MRRKEDLFTEEQTRAAEVAWQNYSGATKWLLSIVTDPTGTEKGKKTLAEIQETRRESFLEADHFFKFLGEPQLDYPAIHVAGTAGKGSTSAFFHYLMMEAGLRSGIHTSPYLQVALEKWQINDKIVSPSFFKGAVDELRKQRDRYVDLYPQRYPNYGTSQVALTHLIFSKLDLDVGVIEAGLGGRFDPTNVINTELAVLTNVDNDHLDVLGPELKDIAWFKAGVIKRGVPVVTGVTQAEYLDIVIQEAREKNARLFVLGRDFSYQVRRKGGEVYLTVDGPFGVYKDVLVPFTAGYQLENASLALAGYDVLSHANPKKYPFLRSDQVESALHLANSSLKGKFEVIQTEPTVILDGAHNPVKIKKLAGSLDEKYAGKNFHLIVGMLESKDHGEGLLPLLKRASRVTATQPNVFGKKSLRYQDMAKSVKELKEDISVETAPDVSQAIEKALSEAMPDDLIVVTGSIYMLGDARNFWHSQKKLLLEAEEDFSY